MFGGTTMTVTELMKEVDKAIAPPMTKEKALEFLEELQSEIEVQADALREDIGKEQRAKPKE
jgi:hypothetical protein